MASLVSRDRFLPGCEYWSGVRKEALDPETVPRAGAVATTRVTRTWIWL